ncbi:MAG: hypothetical protein VZQ47_09915 [Treponema sp.]|nr:hypothetical protein [Treponema sp.]MEE3435859.1 hypothetical protein [Treponema sp.]
MNTNISSYKKDFDKLVNLGNDLYNAIQHECYPEKFKKAVEKTFKEKSSEYLKSLPNFKTKYQSWYSESKALIKQLLPDRLDDFTRYYEKPRTRKSISYENYKIEDYLQGLSITRGYLQEEIVGPTAAIPLFLQQLEILKSINQRFESSLFDIRQLVQADLFDNELSSAKELLNHKFLRAAGAISGVVLEKHLGSVCASHNIKLTKKTPTISDFNDILKSSSVLDTPTWRFIQLLGDIRNLCDHNKNTEPTSEQVETLINGVSKVIKTIF